MFHQLLTPVGDNLLLSFLVASIPIAVVLVLLGVARRPAWQASAVGLIVALLISVTLWRLPVNLALASAANGAVFAVWPIMWIVVAALILYNMAVISGRFDALRRWIVAHLPDDRRVVLIVIGFCFGALLEGVAGFGTTVAICSALLIALGFKPLEALTYSLIFDTAPVAFGALGVPVTTLGAVTGLHDRVLGAMIGRQLPFVALILPFYVMGIYGGLKSLKALWPVTLVAGGAFALAQFVGSNYVGYELTDVFSSIISLLVTLGFLKIWRPAHDPDYACAVVPADAETPACPDWHGWLPWIVISLTVIVWTTFGIAQIGQLKVAWPGLHNAVFITLYGKPYAAVWAFQPLATGTAIILATLICAPIMGIGPKGYLKAVKATWVQARLAILTVMLIIALAYLMNYSGLAYTLGLGVSSAGAVFPLLSAFLGWLAVFLSGSDTSGNALFGNLQVAAAKQLNLNPVLIAASNSSGGVMGKMISPQNISTGCATTSLKGQEGSVFARTFIHSIIMTLIVGLIVLAQQYWFPWMIPAG